jgi:hypothetical protein
LTKSEKVVGWIKNAMKKYIKFLILVVFVIGDFYFVGPFYQEIVVGGDFNFSHMFIGIALLLMAGGVDAVRKVYYGVSKGEAIDMFLGGGIAIIGVGIFLLTLFIS